MEIIKEGDITAEELEKKGAVQIYSFGPGLIKDGEIAISEDTEVDQSMRSNPRTAIGYYSDTHYFTPITGFTNVAIYVGSGRHMWIFNGNDGLKPENPEFYPTTNKTYS